MATSTIRSLDRNDRSDADFRLYTARIIGRPGSEVTAFGAHPAWAHAYLRRATFEAWPVAADDPELAELPPPPSPWPIPDDARARALPVPPLQ